MSDITERLRQQYPETPYHRDALHREAADAIDSLRAQVEALRADAERWQALRHVFHVDEHIGKKTGMPATKLKTHWAGWVAGTHYSAESWADAYIEEAASRSQEAAG